MTGSSEIQPFGLNSTVDPSRCRHLKQKFTEPNSKQIACEDARGHQGARYLRALMPEAGETSTFASYLEGVERVWSGRKNWAKIIEIMVICLNYRYVQPIKWPEDAAC